jgi:hypothetical protein
MKHNGDFGVLYQEQSKRSVAWLQDHGTCIDHIQSGPSTLEHAGSGAFAKRFLPKGTLIAVSPLHHMFRNFTGMYELQSTKDGQGEQVEEEETTLQEEEDSTVDARILTKILNKPVQRAGQQLLLNYCFGRPHESTLLLCPYGPGVNYINHNQTLANVKVRWAPDGTSNHNSTWLSMAPNEMAWNYKISLAMEYVAIQDIRQGDELFMDYGTAWETAWLDHVQRWIHYNPPGPSHLAQQWSPSYQSATQFNAKSLRDHELLRTPEEQLVEPYPSNLLLTCHWDLTVEPDEFDYNLDTLAVNLWDQEKYFERLDKRFARPCTIVERWKSTRLSNITSNITHSVEAGKNTIVWYYDVKVFLNDEEDSVPVHRRGVPRRAISFVDAPYTTDMHLKHAFRHDIQIPSALFPPAWKDKLSDSKK